MSQPNSLVAGGGRTFLAGGGHKFCALMARVIAIARRVMQIS